MVVDASVWVSSLLSEDVHHRRSVEWLRGHLEARQEIVVPALAIAEIAGAVARRRSSHEGHEAERRVLRAPGLQIVMMGLELGRLAADIAARYRLRGADAVYVATARAVGLPLITLDQEIRHRAGSFITIRLLSE